MNSKKGFTLIELLAVIVILAIIALIAVPIILNIINDSKESSDERSKELYIDALEQAIARENLTREFNPSECKIKSGKTICDGEEIKVEVKGKKPTSGSVRLENGKVVSNTLSYEKIKDPVSFAEDDWATIVANVQAGNTSKYKVGDTKEITLTGEVAGTYTVRIANTSTPEKCNQEGFSQTACGFVIEFEDIITTHNMNSTNTNVGGWPASEMRTYVNDTIYESLPKELRDNIINTTVVSGYGPSDTSNFTTIDKLYLLSTKEVWGKEVTSSVINYDTAENETRQLDYYNRIGVTTSNKSGAIKQYNGSSTYWWLRSVHSSYDYSFYYVVSNGYWSADDAIDALGVALAFRIG